MRRIAKPVFVLALSMLLCLGCTALAFASQPSDGGLSGGTVGDGAQLGEGNGAGGSLDQEESLFAGPTITFEGLEVAVSRGSEYHSTDLFGGFKNVMPGDVLKQTVTFANEGFSAVKVYLKAEAHDDEANPLEHVPQSGDRQETVASMREFLSQLTLRVFDEEGKLLYESAPDSGESDDGSASAESGAGQIDSGELGDDAGALALLALGDGDAGGVLLLTLPAKGSGDIVVMLSVPVELDNKYASRVGEVDWVFTFEEQSGSGGLDPEPDESDPDDPLPPVEPDGPLPDAGGDSKPEGPLGQTGDSAPLALLAGISVIAALVVVVAVIMKRATRRF